MIACRTGIRGEKAQVSVETKLTEDHNGNIEILADRRF